MVITCPQGVIVGGSTLRINPYVCWVKPHIWGWFVSVSADNPGSLCTAKKIGLHLWTQYLSFLLTSTLVDSIIFNLHFCRVKPNWLVKLPLFCCSRPPSFVASQASNHPAPETRPRLRSYPRSKDSLGYPAACWLPTQWRI